MCLPAAVIAIGSLAVGAAGVGLQAAGQAKAGKAAKAQATFDSQQNARRSQLALQDADRALTLGEENANLTLAMAGLNTNLTRAISDANVDLINGTTDFNIGVIKATTSFNVSSAEGAASMLEARGGLEAAAHLANADYSELQAQDTLEAGNQAITQSRGQYAQLKGAQRARLAANGVALDEGSALRIQTDTDYQSDVDADTLRTNAIKAALGYRVQAVNERGAAAMATLDGQAQALSKRGEAMATKINGAVGIMEADVNRKVSIADNRMTASMQILQTNLDAQIEARNIRQNAETQAWNSRNAAEGYSAQSGQDARTARSISPTLMAGTSLVNGAARLGSQWYGYSQAGVFG